MKACKPDIGSGVGIVMPAKKKNTRVHAPEPTLRHAWLAGLGLVSVAGREAVRQLEALRAQAQQQFDHTQASVRDGLDTVRRQGEATVGRFSADVDARLAPVLAKLGLKPAAASPRPRVRKATRSPVSKRTRASSVPKRAGAGRRSARG